MKPIHPLSLILFFSVWTAIMGSFLYSWWHVAPSALRLKAEEQGYQIIQQSKAGILEWWSFAKGSRHWIYRVRVRDKSGQIHEGLARVGAAYWFCASASRCPVEFRWGEWTDTLPTLASYTDLTRYGRKGPVFGGRITIRHVVLGFAAADLLLATLVLAFELATLFFFLLCVDEVWTDSLGLNRYLGRRAGPSNLSDARLMMACSLGMFSLYLPAMATLTAGGIGLILRRPWGYYWHLAGSVLVAVTMFGIIYTIPALVIAHRPDFKDYCLGRKVVVDPLGDP